MYELIERLCVCVCVCEISVFEINVVTWFDFGFVKRL